MTCCFALNLELKVMCACLPLPWKSLLMERFGIPSWWVLSCFGLTGPFKYHTDHHYASILKARTSFCGFWKICFDWIVVVWLRINLQAGCRSLKLLVWSLGGDLSSLSTFYSSWPSKIIATADFLKLILFFSCKIQSSQNLVLTAIVRTLSGIFLGIFKNSTFSYISF